ncbi:hypothetical protein ACWF95_35100 [Streptomyces vinaceus]
MPDTLKAAVREPALTPRERQVLALLAGGETYSKDSKESERRS